MAMGDWYGMDKAYDAMIESHWSITVFLEVEADEPDGPYDAQIRVAIGGNPSAEMPAVVMYPFDTEEEAQKAGIEAITHLYEQLFANGKAIMGVKED